MYCEQDNVETLVERVTTACQDLPAQWELILVDDGSTDETLAAARRTASNHPEVVIVELSRNFGQHAAVIAGFAQAAGSSVITLDADLQNPPEEIPRIFDELQNGYDLVHTYRLDRDDTWFRLFASRLTNRAARFLGGATVRDYGCMLRGYSGDLAASVVASNDRRTFIPALAHHLADRTTEIGVAHEARANGTSKYSLLNLLALQLDLVTSLSVRPLRLLTVTGFTFAIAGFGIGMLLMVLRLLLGVTWSNEGTLTILGVVLVFSGAQFIAMGILGEYLGRVHEQLRGRPPYRVRAVERPGLRELMGDRNRPRPAHREGAAS